MPQNIRREKRIFSTLFPIKAERNLEFKLRVLRVVEKLPKDSKSTERLNQVAGELWRRVLKCPVKPFRVNESPSLLVPEEKAHLADGYSFLGPANRQYHLELTDEVITVDLNEDDLDRRDMVCDLLVRSFSDRFISLKDKFWRWHWTLFYKHEPENYQEPNRLAEAFRGIKFSVAWLDNIGLHLAADVRTKYIGRQSLAQYLQAKDTRNIAEHLKTDRRKDERGSCFIRDNRVVRYSCLFAGKSDETVEEVEFEDRDGKRKSVLEYYKNKFKINLAPNDQVIYVKDNEYKEAIPVPASRLFPAFDTEQMRKMHRCLRIRRPPSPQLSPEKRVSIIKNFLINVRKAHFGDVVLELDLNPLSEKQQYFIPPNLLYGGGFTLRYGEISHPKHADNPERLISDWINNKMPSLLRHGFFSRPPLPRLDLWMPSGWDISLRDNIKHFLGNEIKRQCKDGGIELKPRVYETASNIINELKKHQRQHALHIIGLADDLPPSTHPRIKQISEINTQCFSENTANRIDEAGFHRNLALAVLIDAGVKPWILGTDLNYNVYIGIDVLENRAAFHFFWGPGAQKIRFIPGHSVSQARHQEAIKARHIIKYLTEGLRQIHSDTGESIKSLTIHRDGRWWLSEQVGLEKTLEKLSPEIVDENCKIAVVEIRKTHLPVRLFMRKFIDGTHFFANPVPGVYRVLNRNQILMVTTWNPIRPDATNGRTSGVILANVIYSRHNHDILEVGRDVYDLTQLNWTAPGIEINIPVTIRWADHRLREELPKLAEAEEDDLDLEDEEDSFAYED